MTPYKSLGIGEMIICQEPTIVSTILGSCISVCIFSKKHKVGGIIHFALPDRSHATNSGRGDMNFGDTAIRKLHSDLLSCQGLQHKDLEAKIIGGGNVVGELSHSNSIGELNIEIARKTLRQLNVPIVGENVGGPEGRKIFFYSESGRVRVGKLDTQKKAAASATPTKKRILVVDDSKTIRDLLTKILNSSEIEVVGAAASAEEAWPLIPKLKPDVITLDIHMPGMDGVTFLQKYLPVYPIPTVMISSINMHESDLVFKALEFGAVDYIQKPTLQEIALQTTFMQEKILTASQIKVRKKEILNKAIPANILTSGFDKLIAIGASTGGTEAIKEVLLSLPSNIPPIVIVQHIPPIFSTAFAKRLNELCPFEVKEGADGDKVLPGRVIIAPGGMQMELVKNLGGFVVRVFDGERVNRHKPSVDVLFNSVAKEAGKNAVGVILTGMGEDGAMGLLRMKNSGAYTIAQDEESSVVYGMPKAAAKLGAAHFICPLKNVGSSIIKTLEKGKAAS